MVWLATGFGLAANPIGGEVVVFLGALPLAYTLSKRTACTRIAAVLALVAAALPLCHVASHTFEVEDSRQIIADEVLTFPVAITAAPALARQPWILLGAYLGSRALDGVKPPPARQAESLPGGVGIVADDLINNLYAAVLLGGAGRIRARYRR